MPIIIENKVNSTENGKHKNQTQVYYAWAEKEYGDRNTFFDPIYVFLYPEYNATKQSAQEYIRMTYQQLVDYVLEPSMEKCGDAISINNYKAYLQCLSFQTDNEKGEDTMAISNEEKKILDAFIKENKTLICAVLNELKDDDDVDSDALSKITKSVRDYSKYLFEGQKYGKAKLVLAIVKKHVADNPNVTYTELSAAFALKPDHNPLIILEKNITDNDRKYRRFFENEKIILSDGTVIFVNNQIQECHMSKIKEIADSLGYNFDKQI